MIPPSGSGIRRPGRPWPCFRGTPRPWDGLAFSPDGRTLATGSWDGKVLLWDMSTRQSRVLTEGPGVHKLAFSPDGRTLAMVHQKAPPILWDMDAEKPRAVLLGHRGDANHLRFLPDGKTLATAGMDQTVRIWDAASGQELICLTGHQARVNSVAFSPDGRTLASVDHKGAILLWRAGVERQFERVSRPGRRVSRTQDLHGLEWDILEQR